MFMRQREKREIIEFLDGNIFQHGTEYISDKEEPEMMLFLCKDVHNRVDMPLLEELNEDSKRAKTYQPTQFTFGCENVIAHFAQFQSSDPEINGYTARYAQFDPPRDLTDFVC